MKRTEETPRPCLQPKETQSERVAQPKAEVLQSKELSRRPDQRRSACDATGGGPATQRPMARF